jgi:hypothetical protein
MALKFKMSGSRSYATRENAEKAVAKADIDDDMMYLIAVTDEGRFQPVFLPTEAQLNYAIHGIAYRFNWPIMRR